MPKKNEESIFMNNLQLLGFACAVLRSCLEFAPSIGLRIKLKKQIRKTKNNARQLANDDDATRGILTHTLKLSIISGFFGAVDNIAEKCLPNDAMKIYKECKERAKKEARED